MLVKRRASAEDRLSARCRGSFPGRSRRRHSANGQTAGGRPPILEQYGVDLVLGGHSHSYERSYLLNGHYGQSGTLTPLNVLNSGDGRPSGNGAYTKPSYTPVANTGAVYVVAGSSGQISGFNFGGFHPAMAVSLNEMGSLVLDVTGNRLDATFLRDNSSTPDTFTLIKQGVGNQRWPPFRSRRRQRALRC